MCTELRLFTEWEEFTLTWFFYLGCCCRKKKGTELGFLDLCYYIYFVAFFVPFFFFPPFFFVVLDDLTVDGWQVGWQRTGDFLKLLELEALTDCWLIYCFTLASLIFSLSCVLYGTTCDETLLRHCHTWLTTVLSFSFVSSELNKSQTASFIPIKWLKRKEENEKRKKIAGHDVKYQKFNGNLNIPTDSKGGNSKTKSQTFFF